ncbi:hypothetical protein V1498_18660 [Peribacillus sp. SCS-26]|uniref:hypothetical protein n=1 Tax=Paraperibacillus marinus TaxID=3115295 RepID=UPI003906AB50
MKNSWVLLTLMPAPFLFHYYEYGQNIKHEEASFLGIGSVLFVLITGLLSGQVRVRYVVLVNGVTVLLSLLLGIYFIPNDSGWFKPVGRDAAIIFVSVVFLVGQFIVRSVSRPFLVKKES